MDKVTDVRISTCTESKYIQLSRCHYTQNGRPKTWDLITVHKSVVIIIYNVTRNVLILVRQFRPAAYCNDIPVEDRGATVDVHRYPPGRGITLELCAGIVDKDTSLEDIARIEVLEECGYDVPLESFQHVATYRSGVGIAGEWQTLFYTEVNDDMKVSSGGGNPSEDELVEVVEMSLPDVRAYLQRHDVNSNSSFLFGVTWFLANKVKNEMQP